jgi:hypothetical protein
VNSILRAQNEALQRKLLETNEQHHLKIQELTQEYYRQINGLIITFETKLLQCCGGGWQN